MTEQTRQACSVCLIWGGDGRTSDLPTVWPVCRCLELVYQPLLRAENTSVKTQAPWMLGGGSLFTLLKTRHLWDRKGESLLKRKSFDKLGARGFGLKAACSGAQSGKI